VASFKQDFCTALQSQLKMHQEKQ